MPIAKQFRKFYGAVWRNITRPRILKRAGYKCEQCGKPDRTHVWVWNGGATGQYWTLRIKPAAKQAWTYCKYGGSGNFVLYEDFAQCRRILVVLSVCHLNHTSGDDRDENLKALCQWCHLNLDKLHHRETRAARKDRARPLLELLEAR